MPGNRKAAKDYILKWVERVVPGGENQKILSEQLNALSDKEFELLMKDYGEGRDRVNIYIPNLNKGTKVSVENNLALGEELGHDFFQHLEVHSNVKGEGAYLTPNKFLVLELPARRQAQLLYKKLSVPEHSKAIDQLTGQPAGPSRSARISFPELQILRGSGLDMPILELMKIRGGDIKAFDAMNKIIAQHGTVSMKSLEQYSSGVESTRTLNTFLRAMHLESSLLHRE